MSLLWLNQHQLLVAMGAEQLSLIWRTGFAKKIQAKHHQTYQKSISNQNWTEAIQHLDSQLKTLKLPQNTLLTLTLASDLVRYIVLPGHDVAMSANEKSGYAQAAFREIYGASADGWKISVDDGPPTQPTLVSAIDMSLYEALVQLAKKYQLKVNTIEPYLMTAFNRLFSSINHADASLVIIEQTRVLTMSLENGVCQQIRAERLTSDWQSHVALAISRDQLLTNQTSKELMIYAPAMSSIKLEFSKHLSSKHLNIKTKNFTMEPAYSMLEALA